MSVELRTGGPLSYGADGATECPHVDEVVVVVSSIHLVPLTLSCRLWRDRQRREQRGRGK
jgi:hypothetical protein